MCKMEFLRARFALNAIRSSVESTDSSGSFHTSDPEVQQQEPGAFPDSEAEAINISVTRPASSPQLEGEGEGAVSAGDIRYSEKIVIDNDHVISASSEPVVSTLIIEDKEATSVTLNAGSSLAVLSSDDASSLSLKSGRLRARSFTGMMSPPVVSSTDPECESPGGSCKSPASPRESLEHQGSLKVTNSFDLKKRFPVTLVTRRAKVARDGYALRFSSDLGLGSSSKVRAKSKREVFV